MIIHTASEGITLSKQLENDSAEFYGKIADKYEQGAEVFQAYVTENKKNTVQIDRAYYGVITDAIEGGYAFNLETDTYVLSLDIKDGAGYEDAVKQAIDVENKIIQFYEEAAAQSKSLLADVPRAFTLIARKRNNRLEKLESLL